MREMVTKLVTAPYKEDREASLQKIDSISPSYNQPVSRAASTKTVRYIGDIDVTKATNYAKKYAKNANPAYKNFMSTGGDCTNFASQIAYAGGLRYAPVWQPYTKPWINANSFGIVWGKKEKSTKWSIFVKKLKPGMFIAADFGGDGALDHVAYVAANGHHLRISILHSIVPKLKDFIMHVLIQLHQIGIKTLRAVSSGSSAIMEARRICNEE